MGHEADFGGAWDGTLGAVTRDDQWNVVVKKSRGNRDLRPIKPQANAAAAWDMIRMSLKERASRSIASMRSLAIRAIWERITVTVDSGAVNSVGPPTMANGVKIRETPASWAGLKYRAANGAAIDNQGERVIQAMTKQGKKIGMTFQIANVTKPLGSVRAMLDAEGDVSERQ